MDGSGEVPRDVQQQGGGFLTPCTLVGVGAGLSGGSLGYLFGFGELPTAGAAGPPAAALPGFVDHVLLPMLPLCQAYLCPTECNRTWCFICSCRLCRRLLDAAAAGGHLEGVLG